jgi:hypothetical protein
VKKILFLFAFLLVMPTAQAAIEIEKNAYDASVAYKSTRLVRKFSSVDWLFFIKNVAPDGTVSHWIRFMQTGKSPAPDRLELEINEKTYVLQRAADPDKYQRSVAAGEKAFVAWIFPVAPDLLPVLSGAVMPIKLTFIAEDKRTKSAFPAENVVEIIEIIGRQK